MFKYIMAFFLVISPSLVYAQKNAPPKQQPAPRQQVPSPQQQQREEPMVKLVMKLWPIKCGPFDMFDQEVIRGLKMKVLIQTKSPDGNYKLVMANMDGTVIIAHLAFDGSEICVVDTFFNVTSNVSLGFEKM